MNKKQEKNRCGWCVGEDIYENYHDAEWGRPVGDGQKMYEKFCLEGFQSGLSWITILRKRQNFRSAFYDFNPERVAKMTEKDIENLLLNEGIVRHRKKIEATIANAQAFLQVEQTKGSFVDIVWGYAPVRKQNGKKIDSVPSSIPESEALAKWLRSQGFRFLGPTTVYAAMQSLGMVNDHAKTCWAWDECENEQVEFLHKLGK